MMIIFDPGRPNGCEVVFQCAFNLYFSSGQRCRTAFHMLIDHMSILFEAISTYTPLPFLIGLSFCCSIMRVHYIFWALVMSQIHDFKKLVSLCRSSTFLWRSFEVQSV